MRAMLKGAWVVSFVTLLLARSVRAEAPPKLSAFRETDTWTVDEKGDAAYNAKLVFPNEKTFLYMRESFPDPKVILRNVIGPLSRFSAENIKVDFDSDTNSLMVSAEILGASETDKKGRWQLYVGEHFELLFSDPTDSKYVLAGQVEMDGILVVNTSIVELPHGAKNVKMENHNGMLVYNVDHAPKKGSADLDVDLKVKPRVMSAVYKIFANPDFNSGTYWIGKTVFHNTGDGDITHLKVSYQIDGYAPWSPTKEYGLVAAGGHVVNCYYPVLSKEMATLNSATPADVEVKYSYIDSDGQSHEDTTSGRVTLLSSHAIEYSNTPEEDRTGAWLDSFSNSPLIAAFVNRNDDPVRKFEGMVAQACGGVPGGETNESTKKFCQTLYDMMVKNGMSYVLSTEYFVNYTAGQEIKYPRDVLRDKSGTCIELAIFYAAVCESASIECHLVMVPGHCFPVVVLPDGNLMPVEATAISGAALPEEMAKGRKTLPFFDDAGGPGAVSCAVYEYEHRQPGRYYEVNVDEAQAQGVVCPELPPAGDDFLDKYKVFTEGGGNNTSTPATPVVDPQTNTNTPTTTATDITGHFAGQFTNTAKGATGDIQMDITRQGNTLSAQVTFQGGQMTLTGQANGNALSIEGRASSGFDLRMNGQSDGQTIKGQFVNSTGGSGTFIVRRGGS